jgi:hypothetical protein
MATNQVVKVQVQELTKYGFKNNGKFVNYSKNLSEGDKAHVVPGAEFEAEFYIADSGKEYLNKILIVKDVSGNPNEQKAVTSETQKGPTVDVDRAKRFTPKFTKKADDTEKMSKADWNQKDRNMMIGGRSHDAAVIVAAMVNTEAMDKEQALARYRFILEGMLSIAEEIK